MLAGQAPADRDAAIRQEFANASLCQQIVAVNAAEADLLRGLGLSGVSVIGHARAATPTPRAFERRTGMLFVGAIHAMDTPNYDSLCWFVDEVLPLVERELRWETRLTVAGHIAPGVSLDRFREHPRVTLRGPVASLQPLYDSHRLFVAPTRFAAGLPYKVHEAASLGLPVVATAMLAEQLGWEDGRDLLAADATDPVRFAHHIVTLYRDPALWQRLRDAALGRVARENRPDDVRTVLTQVLGPSCVASAGPPL
jgi:glycosyltransferase involved in cell wall biosynthesis